MTSNPLGADAQSGSELDLTTSNPLGADAQSGSELVDSDAFKIGLGVIVACVTVLILVVVMITGYVAWHKKDISFTSAPL